MNRPLTLRDKLGMLVFVSVIGAAIGAIGTFSNFMEKKGNAR